VRPRAGDDARSFWAKEQAGAGFADRVVVDARRRARSFLLVVGEFELT